MKTTIDEYCNNNIIPFRYIKWFVTRNCKIIIYNDDEPSFVSLNRFKQSNNFNKIVSTIKYSASLRFLGKVCYPHKYRSSARKHKHSRLKAANNIRPYTIAELSEV